MFARFILFNKNIAVLKCLTNLKNVSTRNISVQGLSEMNTPVDAFFDHFSKLPVPENKMFATYVWIDGSGITMRSKDRILDKMPVDLQSIPYWSFDGSSTGQAETNDSDTLLIPASVYRDPFRKCPHIIVLCETFHGDGSPTKTNYRAHCAKVLSQISDQEPYFGLEQEYTMLDMNLWPLGWPHVRGYPVIQPKYSYCGVGEHVAGRQIVECHAKACVYSGMDFEGTNAEVMKSSWEFQIGVSSGIRAADDLWMGRYLLNRICELFGVVISYHPKPMGKDHPGIGCHHNFSIKKMRDEGGFKEIERICEVLKQKHKQYMENYGLGDGLENKKRLTGKHETAPFDEFRWGIADRSASVRIQRKVVAERKGFLEDRRPAGDCDPYRVCSLLAEACL